MHFETHQAVCFGGFFFGGFIFASSSPCWNHLAHLSSRQHLRWENRAYRFVYLCRRSNRPGKLSGKRTFEDHKTLESGVDAPAEGITISGARTEGASGKGLLCCDAGICSGFDDDARGAC